MVLNLHTYQRKFDFHSVPWLLSECHVRDLGAKTHKYAQRALTKWRHAHYFDTPSRIRDCLWVRRQVLITRVLCSMTEYYVYYFTSFHGYLCSGLLPLFKRFRVNKIYSGGTTSYLLGLCKAVDCMHSCLIP